MGSKKIYEKIIIFSVVLVSLISIFFIVKPGESITQSYYSGDAISYQNNVYIVTTNTGSLEIFKLADKELVPLTKIRPYNSLFNSYGKFLMLSFLQRMITCMFMLSATIQFINMKLLELILS